MEQETNLWEVELTGVPHKLYCMAFSAAEAATLAETDYTAMIGESLGSRPVVSVRLLATPIHLINVGQK